MVLLWMILLLLIRSNNCGLCNYLYDETLSRAYPTNQCMQFGRKYIKYQCHESSLYPDKSGYTIVMESYPNSTCDINTRITEIDVNEWSEYENRIYNETIIKYTYNCDGIDNCFVEYDNQCNVDVNDYDNDIDTNKRYYPTKQCLNNYNKSISFKYECNIELNIFSYYQYNGLYCIPSNYNNIYSIINITSNECINNNNKYWQLLSCQSTPSPTYIPTESPTPSPTGVPSKWPTIYFPFKNMSLDEIVEVFTNGTLDDSSTHYHIYGTTLTVIIFTLYMIMI